MRHSVVTLTVFLLAAPAFGQVAGVEASGGDNGIKLGEGRLHPYGEIDTHYVINPGRLSDERLDARNSEASDGLITYTAGLNYELPSEVVDLNFESQFFFNQYFRLSRLNGFNANIVSNLEAYKNRPLSFRATAGYTRSAQPGNQVDFAPLFHNDFTGGVGASYRPGGGALTLSLDYQAYYQRYDENQENFTTLANPLLFNSLRQTGAFRGSWKFLPKTSLFIESVFNQTTYPDDAVGANFDAGIFDAYIGLSGAISTRLSVLAKVGYGNPFTSQTSTDFIPIVAQAEVGYLLSETTKFQVGAGRRAIAQPLFGFAAENRVYANWDQQLGKVQFNLGGEVAQVGFGSEAEAPDGATTRSDFVAQVGFGVSYRMTKWLTIGLSETFEVRTSNYDTVVNQRTEGDPDQVPALDFGYITNDLFLRLSARY